MREKENERGRKFLMMMYLTTELFQEMRKQ